MYYENEMEISFRSVPVNEMLARNAVAAFILYLDPEVEELAEIKTAVSEAVTNCIVHGYEENPKGIITLECKISYDRKLYIKVADKGRGIENIEQARRPLFTTGDFEERSGMGFTVMESFMDSIDVVSQPGEGTEVVMTKSLAYSVGR